jgi:hypothetical protein
MVTPHTNPDDKDKANLQNTGYLLNTDVADCPRRFLCIYLL